MKVFTLSVFLLFASNARSFALNSPTSTQLQALQSQITAVQALQSNIVSLTQSIADERGLIDPNHIQIAAWEQQLQNQKARLPPLCQKLMDETRSAYGIRPNRYSGKIVLPGGFKDTYADYRPKFGPMEQTRVKTNRAGRSIAMGHPDSYDAITWENGDIILTIAAFKFSPGYLAAVINHETIHFDQFTTRGRGDKINSTAREREAYNMMLGLTNRSIFNLSPTELRVIDERFENAIRNAPFSPNGTMVGASGFYSVDLTRNPNGEELLLQAMSEAKELAAKQRELIEQERQRDHDERLKNAWAALALRSCANPGSVSQADLDSLPKPYDTDVLNSSPRGLGECGGLTYNMLRMGASAEAIRRISSPEAPVATQPPPPAEAVQPIRETPIARQPAPPPFSEAFPLMKEFALEACRAPEQVAISGFLTQRYDFSHRDYDDELARKYAAGLGGGCAGQLFNRLFAMLRAGDVYAIDRQWIRSKVAEEGGGSSGGRPQYGGPDQTHPIIVFPKPPW